MNDLSQITAVCVDTLNHELAVDACWRMAEHGFADVVLFTDNEAEPYLPLGGFSGFRVERIAPLKGISAYSDFMLHHVVDHIPTSHALVFQWDGFVLDANRWNPEFLDYDYIGAIWPCSLGGRVRDRPVGNGGFCLRSLKLMRAVSAMAPESTSLPEDALICQELAGRLEDEHQVRFAPAALAKHFSIENLSLPQYRSEEPHLVCDEPFGFHGFFNFHLAFDDFALINHVDNNLGQARNSLLRSRHAAALIVNLAAAGRTVAAAEITMRCAPLLGLDPAHVTMHDVVRRYQTKPALA